MGNLHECCGPAGLSGNLPSQEHWGTLWSSKCEQHSFLGCCMIVSSVLLGTLQQPQSQGTEITVGMEKCFSLGTSLRLPLARVPSVLQRPYRNNDEERALSLLQHQPRRQLAARPPARPSSLWGCHHQRCAARSCPARGHRGPPPGSARIPLPKVTPTAAL